MIPFLQYSSAYLSYLFFWVSGVSANLNGTTIDLQSIQLNVAPECSGYNSTFWLMGLCLIFGLLGKLSIKNLICLIGFALAIGIVRNSLRIYTIGLSCNTFGPNMINSWVHTGSSKIWFALSVVPVVIFWNKVLNNKLLDKQP